MDQRGCALPRFQMDCFVRIGLPKSRVRRPSLPTGTGTVALNHNGCPRDRSVHRAVALQAFHDNFPRAFIEALDPSYGVKLPERIRRPGDLFGEAA
jgi:hypothetical protein